MKKQKHLSNRSFILGAVSLIVLGSFFPERTLAATAKVTAPAQSVQQVATVNAKPVRNPFKTPAVLASQPADAPLASAPPVVQPLTATLSSIAVIPLSYVQAADIAQALSSLFGKERFGIDKATNSLLFKGTPAEENCLRQAVQQLDKATRQVTLEAKIIALSREHSSDLGINWSWDRIPRRGSTTDNTDDDNADTDDNYDGNFKFWHGYSFRFSATLNALIANGKAKILATPRIITIPGKEASIFIGDHIPVQTEKYSSSGNYTTTEYVDAGIKLQYTPIVSTDGSLVTAQVHTEVSTPTLISQLKNYRITSRTADTNVRMHSGETLVIGGLISDEEQRTLQKVPLLSNIPLLGELFKNRSKRHVKTEVLMLLTPHVTEAGSSPAIYKQHNE